MTTAPLATKAATTRRANTQRRNKLIIEQFRELYQVKRLRFDDVLLALAAKFALTVGTVRKVLKQAD